jgi:hypothetical protein
MTTRTSHSGFGGRSRRLVTLGGVASGLILGLSGLHSALPVAAQTVTTPIPQLEDRGAPEVDQLLIPDRHVDDEAFAGGLDDRALGDPDLLLDVPQEDRLTEAPVDVRQEDRLTEAPADVRQEDRSPAVTDDSRGGASVAPAQPYYSAPAIAPAKSTTSSSATSTGSSATTTSSSSTRGSSSSTSGGSGRGGHDDGAGHH